MAARPSFVATALSISCFGLVLSGAASSGLTRSERAPQIPPWGFDLKGETPAVRAGDDFFAHANGAYVAALQIPPDRSGWGSFDILNDLSEQRVHGILDEAAAAKPTDPNSPKAQIDAKIGAFFKAYLDEATVEKAGIAPLKPDLEAVAKVTSKGDFAALMGTAPLGFQASLIDLGIGPDAKDPDRYSVTIGQSGLGLPDRDYYLKPNFAPQKAKYQAYVAQLLGFAEWPNPGPAAKAIVDFETKVAEASWARADRRDPIKTYNPTTPAELSAKAPGLDWARFLGAAGVDKVDRVIVAESTAVPAIAALVATTPLDTLKAWAAFHLADSAARDLPKRFVDAAFEFHDHVLSGQLAQKPRWKRGVEAADTYLGEAVGQIYVERFFPPAAKAAMDRLTGDLKAAFRRRLQNVDWMGPATKAKALEKLENFAFQVGYPKKWRDYSSYRVTSDDLYGDTARGIAFEWKYWLGHLGHKVDRDEWEMNPQTVNAYNMPVFNEVVFPAAILQPPFFDPAADPAINYGGIGGVIGHEMTHGFDDEGRHFDAHGRLQDWWTPEDAKRFEARAAVLGAQFDAMTPLPGMHINGKLTMGENIADLGGLNLALDAYHASLHGKPAPVLNGLTGDQRVFLGWAQVWRAKRREDSIRQRLVVDPHSPPEARVNGPVHNIDAWYAAWGVKPGDKLYLPPDKRAKIW